MKDIQLKQLYRETDRFADREVTVRGWIRTNRSSNKFGFVEINDGSFFKSVQVVYEDAVIDNYELIAKAPIAAALLVKGTLVLTPEAKQPFEIKATEILVEADSDSDYPLQKKRHSVEFLRSIQCDQVQGFLICGAISCADFETLLLDDSSKPSPG